MATAQKNKITERQTDNRWGEKFQNWFNVVSSLDVDGLLRASNPEYNFQEIRPQINVLMSSFDELSKNYDFWEPLPDQRKQNIQNCIAQLIDSIDRIGLFDAKQNNAWQDRANLVNRFASNYDEIYTLLIEKLQAYLGMRAYSNDLTSNFSKQAKEQLDEIGAVRSKIYDIQKSIEDASTVATSTATNATAHFFHDEAEKHEASARRWLWGTWVFTVILGIIVSAFVWDTVGNISSSASSTDSIHPAELSLKIVITATILIALRFGTKNYNANKHLAVINRHRANVLSTIEAYRQSANNDDTKDIILKTGVITAFNTSETGYISTKEGAGSSDGNTTDLLNIFRSGS